MQQKIKKSEKKASKIPFYLFIRVYLFLLLRDLITKKQSAAQHKVSTTHCV